MDLEILNNYNKVLIARNYATKTKNSYRKAFRAFFIANKGEINGLNSQQINNYLLNLPDLSPSKMIITSAAIKVYYLNCLDKVITTTKVKKHETTPVILTNRELNNFFCNCETYENVAIFSTIYYLGLRKQELLNLKLSDFNLSKVTIRDGKGGQDRVLTCNEQLTTILERYINLYAPQANEPLFNITAGQISYFFRDILRKAKINKPATPHDLRHTAAVNMYNSGVDILAIQRFLGHKSINSTLVYTKFATGNGAQVPGLKTGGEI